MFLEVVEANSKMLLKYNFNILRIIKKKKINKTTLSLSLVDSTKYLYLDKKMTYYFTVPDKWNFPDLLYLYFTYITLFMCLSKTIL